MIRLFNQHEVRKTIDLEGLWDFGKIKTKDSEVEYSHKLLVPGCWEEHPDFYNYRGLGVFRKKVTLEDAKAIRLHFKGVSHTAHVYFDGEYLGQHYNAYTPFCFVKKNVEKGEHEIKVFVDNSFSEDSALHVPNDYYTYGGITRGAVLEYVEETYISQIHFTPMQENGMWIGKVEGQLLNISEKSQEVQLTIDIAGEKKVMETTVQPKTIHMVSCLMKFKDVKAWDMETPHLYSLKSSLVQDGKIIDDHIERVGFRSIEVEGTDILLNGASIFIKGFNRHEDSANFGCSIPVSLMMKDIELMKDMGANSVRTCHYPNDELFLDLCDEYGLLVWEENHARGLKMDIMSRPNFEKQCEDCIQEMVVNHYNHPSIFVWGILNECASQDPEGSRMYQKQFDQIKELDETRPVTFACDKHFKCLSLDMTDIASLNVYYNWYHDYDVTAQAEKEIGWVNEVTSHKRPIIISEFGGGALYGYRSPHKVRWSEERQCEILEECITKFSAIDQVKGLYIWQYCDVRVTEEEWAMRRPRTMNNKGIVDEYRRPKLAFETVKKLWK